MRWTRRLWMTLAAISGFVSVAAGAFAAHGLTDRAIGTVSGDDLLPRLDDLLAAGHALNNLDTGEPLATACVNS